MLKEQIKLENIEWLKVRKEIAEKIYNNGGSVALLPALIRTDSIWVRPFLISHGRQGMIKNFQTVINSYEHFNCSSEVGKYAKYFVNPVDLKKIKLRKK